MFRICLFMVSANFFKTIKISLKDPLRVIEFSMVITQSLHLAMEYPIWRGRVAPLKFQIKNCRWWLSPDWNRNYAKKTMIFYACTVRFYIQKKHYRGEEYFCHGGEFGSAGGLAVQGGFFGGYGRNRPRGF
jgi:hypothetical protein